jgi:tRNA threonylcarbamoyl adenosine modification protein (Sua5/YciO/YrdC/YwlC family)
VNQVQDGIAGMSIVHISDLDMVQVIEALESSFIKGDPAVMPTDTLYGIGAPVTNEKALRRIFKIKCRPSSQTLPVAVGDMDMMHRIAVVNDWRLDYIRERLPGPYTFVLPARGLSEPMVVRDMTVAVRIPGHPLYGPLTSRMGPIALTSANPHGGRDISSASVLDGLYHGSLLIIEDDRSIRGRASEMIDLTGDRPRVLRSGNLNNGTTLEDSHG